MTENVVVELKQDTWDAQIPKPVGYKMLIALPKSNETFDSGIVKAAKTREAEEVATTVGRVVDIGPDAYKDDNKFPSGPWCQVGDYVVFRAYTGTRIKVNGTEWRLLNDDQIEGTVTDPAGVSRP